jgi:glutamine synthetase
MNETMHHFINGVLKKMPEFTCLPVPKVNGHKFHVPENWASDLRYRDVEDSGCSLKVRGDSEKSLHIAFRLPGADMNPHTAISSLLGAGLWGIENKIDSDFGHTAYDRCPTSSEPRHFNKNLEEVTHLLNDSVVAKEMFGERFVNHYVKTRQLEYMQNIKTVSSRRK